MAGWTRVLAKYRGKLEGRSVRGRCSRVVVLLAISGLSKPKIRSIAVGVGKIASAEVARTPRREKLPCGLMSDNDAFSDRGTAVFSGRSVSKTEGYPADFG